MNRKIAFKVHECQDGCIFEVNENFYHVLKEDVEFITQDELQCMYDFPEPVDGRNSIDHPYACGYTENDLFYIY